MCIAKLLTLHAHIWKRITEHISHCIHGELLELCHPRAIKCMCQPNNYNVQHRHYQALLRCHSAADFTANDNEDMLYVHIVDQLSGQSVCDDEWHELS